jgi:8-oxo-dGTP diphosphatase
MEERREMSTKYVLGFLFSHNESRVVLIHKRRPDWQAGKFNGVGGHVEDGESPVQAMRRGFIEEAGLDVPRWRQFANLRGDGFIVFMFRASMQGVDEIRTVTDERVDNYHIAYLPSNVLPNLRWLIPMAMSSQSHDWPFTITERDEF